MNGLEIANLIFYFLIQCLVGVGAVIWAERVPKDKDLK